MFPHTHAYTTKEITGRSDSLLIYGSVLPDIALTGILDWTSVSKRAEEFRNWLISKDGSYSDLGLGMMLHEFPCGIDRFAHTSYKGGSGYVVENYKPIIKDVSTYYGIALKEAKATAHSFIETGVEFLVIQDNPSVIELLRTSVDNVNITKIAEYFAQFYETTEDEKNRAFTKYNQTLVKPDYSSVDGLTELWRDMHQQLFGTEIDRDKTQEFIEKSINIVKPTYREFISDVIKVCKEDVKKYI